ncbi:hypothetical protein MY11210_003471 [Beauveria gryllotalpidicola]
MSSYHGAEGVVGKQFIRGTFSFRGMGWILGSTLRE